MISHFENAANLCKTKKCHVNLNIKVGNSTEYKDYPVVAVLSIHNLTLFYNDEKIKEINMNSIERINTVPLNSKNSNLCKEKCFEIMVAQGYTKTKSYEIDYFTLCVKNLLVKLKYVAFFKKMRSCHQDLYNGKSTFDIKYTTPSRLIDNKTKPKSNILNQDKVPKIDIENTEEVLNKNIKDVIHDYSMLNQITTQIHAKKGPVSQPNPIIVLPTPNPPVVKSIEKIKDIIAEEELVKTRMLKQYKQKLLQTKKNNKRVIEKDEIINLIASKNQKVRQKIRQENEKKIHLAKEEKLVEDVAKKYRENAKKERDAIKKKIEEIMTTDNEKSTERGRELLIRIANIERKIPFDYRLCTNKKQMVKNKTAYFSQLCKEIFSPDVQSEHNCNKDERFCGMCCSDHSFTNSLPSEYCEDDCLKILARVNVINKSKKKKCAKIVSKQLENKETNSTESNEVTAPLHTAARNSTSTPQASAVSTKNTTKLSEIEYPMSLKDVVASNGDDNNNLSFIEKGSKGSKGTSTEEGMNYVKMNETDKLKGEHLEHKHVKHIKQIKHKKHKKHKKHMKRIKHKKNIKQIKYTNDKKINETDVNEEEFKKLYFQKYVVKDF